MASYVAVAIGGGAGALLRFLAGQWVPQGHWTTMGINWMGCLLLGFLLTYAARSGRVPETLKLGLGTGVLGGFTTFSTFSLEMLQMAQGAAYGELALYLLGSLAGGVLLAGVGVWLAERVTGEGAKG